MLATAKVRWIRRAAALSLAACLALAAAGLRAQEEAPPERLSFRETLKLQILLDRQNFSCNCADGVWGGRTIEALKTWQAQRGLRVTGWPNPETWAGLGAPDDVFTQRVVAATDIQSLTPVPKSWSAKSEASFLGYETLLEALAERGHTSQKALRRLNPQAPWPNPPPGTEIVLPNPEATSASPRATRVRISLGHKWVRAYDESGNLVAHFPCSIARSKTKRPVGFVEVKNIAPNPNYVFDPALFAEDPESQTIGGKRIIPPGPNNPVGLAWIGLNLSGYGLHGTPRPEDIGMTESHGCFRLTNWNAEKLLHMVEPGTPVYIEE